MTREEMRERLRLVAAIAGYPLFYVFCFVAFVSLIFPYDVLKERIVLQFNATQRAAGAPQELSIDDMTSSWLTGVKAIGVHLTQPPATGDAKAEPVVLTVDEARANISIPALLIGRRKVKYSIDGFGGTVDGYFEEIGTDREVEVNLDAIDLAQVAPLTALLGVPIEGHLGGKIHIEMPDGKASKGTGTVDLQGTDIAVGDGKAKLKGLLALPRVVVGDLGIAAEAKEGILKFTKFEAGGKDVEIGGEGRILMRELATESVCDVTLKFKVNDAYKGKSDLTKNLFGAPGSTKGGDLEMLVPQVKAAKRQDGYFGFHVRGLLGRPDFDPAPNASGFGNGAGGSTSGIGTSTPPSSGTGTGMSLGATMGGGSSGSTGGGSGGSMGSGGAMGSGNHGP
ncbi:MAG: type II secretion system protein GspN [Polyangiaceae bacterium]